MDAVRGRGAVVPGRNYSRGGVSGRWDGGPPVRLRIERIPRRHPDAATDHGRERDAGGRHGTEFHRRDTDSSPRNRNAPDINSTLDDPYTDRWSLGDADEDCDTDGNALLQLRDGNADTHTNGDVIVELGRHADAHTIADAHTVVDAHFNADADADTDADIDADTDTDNDLVVDGDFITHSIVYSHRIADADTNGNRPTALESGVGHKKLVSDRRRRFWSVADVPVQINAQTPRMNGAVAAVPGICQPVQFLPVIPPRPEGPVFTAPQ